jgi:hypothetical protein
MAVVTELITKFGFEGSLDPLKNYNGSLGQGVKLLAGLGAALAGVIVGINAFAASTSQSLQPLINLNKETGVSLEKLQELSFVAQQSSSSTEALFSSIGGLSTKIGEAAQKGSEDFSRLGISVRTASGQVKSADAVLAEVGNRFRQLGLSLSEQKGFAEALGIDASLLSMLNKTGAQIGALSAEARRLGILTTEQVKSAENFNDALGALGFGMDAVKRLISVGLAPELTTLTKDFMDLLAANKDFIVDGVKATVSGIRVLAEGLIRVAPFIAAVGAAFFLAKVSALGFSGAVALIFTPAIIAAAKIAFLFLLVDDLIVAFDGGKSVIRDFFLEATGFDIQPALIALVDGFKEAFETIKNLVTENFNGIVTIFSGIGSIIEGDFKAGFDKVGEGLTEITDAFALAFKLAFEPVFDFLKQKALDILPDWAIKILSGVGGQPVDLPPTAGGLVIEAGDGVFSAITDIFSDSLGFFFSSLTGDQTPAMAGGQAFQPGGARGGSINQSNYVEQIVNMDIRTADPQRAGQAAADALQRQLNDGRNQTVNRISR